MRIPTIKFKAKVKTCHYTDESKTFEFIEIPKSLGKRHCDMSAFRCHSYFSSYANSDFFTGILGRYLKSIGITKGYFRLDDLPQNVTVDNSKFLAVVTISVPADYNPRK
jgi:hypothetical protein